MSGNERRSAWFPQNCTFARDPIAQTQRQLQGMNMTERGEGQRSWQLSPYELNVSYGQPGAAGQGADWFGPLTLITPLAPPDVARRQWDYPSGYNLSTTPRINEPVSFQTLRGLAEGYDLLRLVIETRKDQVSRLSWTIGSRDKKSSDTRIAALRTFFMRPDGIHTFGDWLRLLLEELFVIDAPALYMSRDRGGRLTALLPIDGATIKPVIDDWGRTPAADHRGWPHALSHRLPASSHVDNERCGEHRRQCAGDNIEQRQFSILQRRDGLL
jgi:hypothetical protein